MGNPTRCSTSLGPLPATWGFNTLTPLAAEHSIAGQTQPYEHAAMHFCSTDRRELSDPAAGGHSAAQTHHVLLSIVCKLALCGGLTAFLLSPQGAAHPVLRHVCYGEAVRSD